MEERGLNSSANEYLCIHRGTTGIAECESTLFQVIQQPGGFGHLPTMQEVWVSVLLAPDRVIVQT